MHIYPRQAGGGVGLDIFGDTAVAETATLFVEKKRGFVCTTRQMAPYGPPAGECCARLATDENRAPRTVFALDKVAVAVCIQVAMIDRGQLGEAHSGGVKQFEYGMVADESGIVGFRRFQQGSDLLRGERAGCSGLRLARQFKIESGVGRQDALAV